MADSTEDIRTRLENAIQLAATTKSEDRFAVQRAFGTLGGALKAALEALAERDANLDLITDPSRDAAAELSTVQKKLESAQNRITELEQKLMMSKHEREIEDRVHDEDRRRLKELEKRAKTFDKVIMDDDDAFDRFMNQALDEGDRKGRNPPTR